jgi:uncharacterized cupin superfamily protein
MPLSGTGERVTPVLDVPSRDGLSVKRSASITSRTASRATPTLHPAGAYACVTDGSVEFVVRDGEPIVVKAGESFYEPPGALHSVSRMPAGTRRRA